MNHQVQGTQQGLQAAASSLRRPGHAPSPGQVERANEARAARRERASVSPAQHKPVLETDEFRVVEPDGTEDPWASADDGVVPERPAPERRDRRSKDD